MDGKLVAAIGIVVALAVALVVAITLDGGDTVAAPTTTTSAPPTTEPPTTTTLPPTTTSLAPTTTVPPTTTTVDSEVRRQEVEAIVTEAFFGFFDAIYRQDEEALRSVVATPKLLEDGIGAMARVETSFSTAPTLDGTDVNVTEVLLDRLDCLVVDVVYDLSAFRTSTTSGTEVIMVLWPHADGTWRRATQWGATTPESVWIDDCDLLERTDI